MHESPPAADPPWQVDPIYRNSLREARFVLGLWAVCFVYTVAYCYLFGYQQHEPLPGSTGPDVSQVLGSLESFNRDASSLTYPLGLGIPDWVFYGIALPWAVCMLLSFWYGLFMFSEDDLSDGELVEAGEEQQA